MTDPPAPRPVTAAQRTELLHRMLLVRRLVARGAGPTGTPDLPAGEEAIAVGVVAALGPADTVVAASRSHGLTLAVELAQADLARHRPAVTACFFGGPAASRPEFTVCVDLAVRRHLPVLFCCADHEATDPPAPSGLVVEPVDGLDVEAVIQVVLAALRPMRAGTGPRLLHLRAYGGRALPIGQAADGGPPGDEAGERDPIRILAGRMRTDHQLDDNALRAIDLDAAAYAEAAAAGRGRP